MPQAILAMYRLRLSAIKLFGVWYGLALLVLPYRVRAKGWKPSTGVRVGRCVLWFQKGQ